MHSQHHYNSHNCTNHPNRRRASQPHNLIPAIAQDPIEATLHNKQHTINTVKVLPAVTAAAAAISSGCIMTSRP